jgi:hypothetical protein
LAQLLDSTYSDDFRTQAQTEDKTSCSDKPYLAGLRWFWTAQMRYHLQDHPKVLNLDPNHRSYYTFRDENLDLKGCSVIIIAHDRHIDRDLLATLIDIESEEKLLVPLHEKMNIYLLRGRFLR